MTTGIIEQELEAVFEDEKQAFQTIKENVLKIVRKHEKDYLGQLQAQSDTALEKYQEGVRKENQRNEMAVAFDGYLSEIKAELAKPILNLENLERATTLAATRLVQIRDEQPQQKTT